MMNDSLVRGWAIDFCKLPESNYSDAELKEAVRMTQAEKRGINYNTSLELLHHAYEELNSGE